MEEAERAGERVSCNICGTLWGIYLEGELLELIALSLNEMVYECSTTQ